MSVDLDGFGSLLFFLIALSYLSSRTPKERAIVLVIAFALATYFDVALDGAPSRGYF